MASLNWTVSQKSVDLVKSALTSSIAKSAMPSFVQTSWVGDELCVKIEKGGKSEIRLTLKPNGSDVNIVETKRDVAFLHKPFVSQVETAVQKILNEVGGQKA